MASGSSASAEQGRSKRHHTVPRFYLRRFADDTKHVMRVLLPGDRQKPTSIKSASVVDDFYTVQLVGGELSDEYERLWGRIEDAAAPAFVTMLDRQVWPLPVPQKQAIAAWAALQVLRTPIVRQGMSDIQNQMARLEIGVGGKAGLRQRMEQTFGRSVDDEELDRAWHVSTRPEGPGFVATPEAHIRTIVDLLPGTAHLFFDRGWLLVRFDKPCLFTSDNPVALVPDLHDPDGAVGIGTAKHIVVPMDRRTAIVMHELGMSDFDLPALPEVRRYITTVVLSEATRAVFHHPADKPLAGLTLPGPREQQMTALGIDGLIREEGLFSLKGD